MSVTIIEVGGCCGKSPLHRLRCTGILASRIAPVADAFKDAGGHRALP